MRRAVATIAPPTTIHTPTPSTPVPMISMIRRKDSMAVFIAVKRADFQCCFTWRKFARSSFENDAGDRVMLRVAESDQGRSYAALCSKLVRWSGKDEKRFAALFFLDVDAPPAHRFPDASTECF